MSAARRIARLDRAVTRFLDVTWSHLLPCVVGLVIMLALVTVSAQLFGWGQP